ncbi:DUF2911 domain-containing protein [Flavobacteriaceae bacterium]|jgi:hypothetical protein|nr:DUF2911 domain-containing protein [Flavobacteriaceae bacterium]MDA7711437.1 DUF2911 domain-containing protein [Flavobacteriaceae bacterium]
MRILKLIGLMLLVVGVAIIGYFTYVLFINPASPNETIYYQEAGKDITLNYSRPYKKERLIFGEATEGALLPYGVYWRLGANMATRIESKTDLVFGGRNLPAGKYRLYCYPYADHWLVVVHDKASGSGAALPDSEGIVMQLNRPTAELENALEQFTIDFEEGTEGLRLRMRWDTTEVSIPIQ